jgi:hypothetical protein
VERNKDRSPSKRISPAVAKKFANKAYSMKRGNHKSNKIEVQKLNKLNKELQERQSSISSFSDSSNHSSPLAVLGAYPRYQGGRNAFP